MDQMKSFSTEFPLENNIDKADFVFQIREWLRGNSNSRILHSKNISELDGEYAHLIIEEQEQIKVRSISKNNELEAIGFQHILSDSQGRDWRTECVVCNNQDGKRETTVRFQSICTPRMPEANLLTPKKPYIIKNFLAQCYPTYDGLLSVSDIATCLPSNSDGLSIASNIITGDATYYLPVVYISSTGLEEWALEKYNIEKLAFDLGGIAHVVVEPDRRFSFDLRTICGSKNTYDGTIGIYLPGTGLFRRHFVGWRIETSRNLMDTVRTSVTAARTNMPVYGWDWTDLQESTLKSYRETNKKSLSSDQIEELYQEEIRVLQAKIGQLEHKLRNNDGPNEENAGFIKDTLLNQIGTEFYPGEFSDRIKFAITVARDNSENLSFDSRTTKFLEKFDTMTNFSESRRELIDDISKTAGKGKRYLKPLKKILGRIGFEEKSDSNHTVMQPNRELFGIGNITLPKTPSDGRGPMNSIKQILKILGLTTIEK